MSARIRVRPNPNFNHPDVQLVEDVLGYWIGPASNDALVAEAKTALWFRKSFETDHEIARLFVPTMAALRSGLSRTWAAKGAHGRLAAIIALDQFSRNVFRDRPAAFENDRIALSLALAGLANDQDRDLTEVERAFFYLPLEHAEDADMQRRSVECFKRLDAEARPEFASLTASWLDYAVRHKVIIDRFGRFPHRNRILGRQSTREETEFLKQPGSGF